MYVCLWDWRYKFRFFTCSSFPCVQKYIGHILSYEYQQDWLKIPVFIGLLWQFASYTKKKSVDHLIDIIDVATPPTRFNLVLDLIKHFDGRRVLGHRISVRFVLQLDMRNVECLLQMLSNLHDIGSVLAVARPNGDFLSFRTNVKDNSTNIGKAIMSFPNDAHQLKENKK